MSRQSDMPTRDPILDVPSLDEVTVPPVSVSSAVARHWLVALLPVVILVGFAVAAAGAREANYTAQSRLAVGRLDAGSPAGLSGFTSASQSLAQTYSRSVGSDQIVGSVARELRLRPAEVRASLTGSPVPQTPVFRIQAEAEDARTAVAIARNASDALVREAESQSRSNPQSDRLLRRYRAAVQDAESSRTEAEALKRAIEDDDTAANRAALTRARSSFAEASARADGLKESYGASLQSAGSVAVVQIIQQATGATSDRQRVLQLLLFAAVALGAIVGVALAVLRERRQTRRLLGL